MDFALVQISRSLAAICHISDERNAASVTTNSSFQSWLSWAFDLSRLGSIDELDAGAPAKDSHKRESRCDLQGYYGDYQHRSPGKVFLRSGHCRGEQR